MSSGQTDLGFHRPVGEGRCGLAPLRPDIAYVGIGAAYVVDIVGKKFARAEFHVQAPTIGNVDFETDSISDGSLGGAVLFPLKLAFRAVLAQVIPLAIQLRLRIGIIERWTNEHVGRVKELPVSVDVGHEIELKLRRDIGNEAPEMEITPLFVGVFGIGIVGADLANVCADFQAEPVIEVIASTDPAGQVQPVEPPVSIQIAEVVGSADPAAGFPAAHLSEGHLAGQHQPAEQRQKSKLLHISRV